jgi:hypothetical protein
MRSSRLLLGFLLLSLTFNHAELDLKALTNRKDLWPKEITLMKTLTYSQGKTFYLGSKQPLLEISADEILFGEGNSRYRLDPRYTNLSLLIDETALLQSAPTTSSTTPGLNPTQMEGPDFSFLLNTKVELNEADRLKAIDLLLTQGGYLKAAAQLRQALYESYESGGANSPEWTVRLYLARICMILGEKESNLKKRTPYSRTKEILRSINDSNLKPYASFSPPLLHLQKR